jgi:hypothetical protein
MRLRSPASSLVIGVSLLVSAVAPATADTQPVIHTAANHLSSAQMDAYWTPARIANAKPVAAPAGTPVTAPAPTGAPVSVAGTPAKNRGVYETTGRLLFSANGGDWICTATVVASNNRSVIATARHCGFNDGGTNFRYAPNYNGGNAPHGWWDWRSAGWATGGDGITNDLAFIVLNQKDGRRVGDVVGTNGIGFNQAVNQYAYIVGIPGATDQKFRCEGGAYAGPQGQQLMNNCNGMSGGASGGSWNINWQPAGWAYQVGTFFGSYGAAAAGSYYGQLAYDIWNGAQNA